MYRYLRVTVDRDKFALVRRGFLEKEGKEGKEGERPSSPREETPVFT